MGQLVFKSSRYVIDQRTRDVMIKVVAPCVRPATAQQIEVLKRMNITPGREVSSLNETCLLGKRQEINERFATEIIDYVEKRGALQEVFKTGNKNTARTNLVDRLNRTDQREIIQTIRNMHQKYSIVKDGNDFIFTNSGIDSTSTLVADALLDPRNTQYGQTKSQVADVIQNLYGSDPSEMDIRKLAIVIALIILCIVIICCLSSSLAATAGYYNRTYVVTA
jgi:hypothetical protein